MSLIPVFIWPLLKLTQEGQVRYWLDMGTQNSGLAVRFFGTQFSRTPGGEGAAGRGQDLGGGGVLTHAGPGSAIQGQPLGALAAEGAGRVHTAPIGAHAREHLTLVHICGHRGGTRFGVALGHVQCGLEWLLEEEGGAQSCPPGSKWPLIHENRAQTDRQTKGQSEDPPQDSERQESNKQTMITLPRKAVFHSCGALPSQVTPFMRA